MLDADEAAIAAEEEAAAERQAAAPRLDARPEATVGEGTEAPGEATRTPGGPPHQCPSQVVGPVALGQENGQASMWRPFLTSAQLLVQIQQAG